MELPDNFIQSAHAPKLVGYTAHTLAIDVANLSEEVVRCYTWQHGLSHVIFGMRED